MTFSFLISSPMVDLGSLILLMSIFGWKVAVVYVIVGLVIAVAGGTLIEKLHLESEVEEFIRNGKSIDTPQNELTKRDRLKYNNIRTYRCRLVNKIKKLCQKESEGKFNG